jgi:hypothetical protein
LAADALEARLGLAFGVGIHTYTYTRYGYNASETLTAAVAQLAGQARPALSRGGASPACLTSVALPTGRLGLCRGVGLSPPR